MTQATLHTSEGPIEVELYPDEAPKTVENFTKLAGDGYYDGLSFHRVIPDFMIQGGCPKGDGTGGPGYTFEDEFNEHKVTRGALAMANAGPGTNGSQFFIVTAEATPWLDGKHTVFGRVTSGQDVVDRISAADRDARDRPQTEITIERVELLIARSGIPQERNPAARSPPCGRGRPLKAPAFTVATGSSTCRRAVRLTPWELEGKTAVVTGASSGIGAATVRRLREAGARVVGGARRVERVDADVALPLDVTDESSSRAFVEGAVAELGGIDILFNNAGLALGRVPFTESTAEDEQTVLHTNVDGVLRITRLALPHIRDGGHIVFMGSIAGRQAYPNGASYIASKFAVRGFSYALREDLLGRPIRITTVDAGLVETEFSVVRFGGDREKADAVYEGIQPVTADEVADCVLFALTRPPHVNLDEIVIKAIAQSSGARVVRSTS